MFQKWLVIAIIAIHEMDHAIKFISGKHQK